MSSLLVSAAFEIYRSDQIVFKNQSRKTEEAYAVAGKFFVLFAGDIDVTAITFPLVRDWKLWLCKTRGEGTVRNYIICLRAVIKYLKKSGYDVMDYELIPVPKRAAKLPKFIESAEVAKLIEEAGRAVRGYSMENRLRNMAAISLLYASGVRASEVVSLDRTDIRGNSFSVVGKGGKARLCFVDERTVNLIENYLSYRQDNHPALFLSERTGKRMSTNTLAMMFRNVCARAGYSTHIHPHIMRHSFATNLLQNNANMRYVQELLGHSSLATTQIYTHVVNRDLQKIYENFHTT